MLLDKIYISIALLIGSFLVAGNVNAQFFRKRTTSLVNTRAIFNQERLEVTGGVGLSSYYGDLCEDFSCMQFRPNVGIGARLRMNDYTGIVAEINYFRLYSEDVWEHRNLGFRSNNVEFWAGGHVQLLPFTRHERRKPKFNPYAFGGIGLLWFSPRGELDGEWYSLRQYETEGERYSPITFMVPYGAGIKFHFTQHWDFLLELGYRMTFSDRIDDVSSYDWTPPSEFEDPVALALAYRGGKNGSTPQEEYEYWRETDQPRGNPTRNDGYFISQFKVAYTITSNKSHYRLRRSPLRKRY